jgi:hypothetical protein
MMYGFQDVGPGWVVIMERLCARLQFVAGLEFRLTSVKMKGTLRISFRGGSDVVAAAVDAAKAEALDTCELCGRARPLLEKDGFWAVRCGKCAVG